MITLGLMRHGETTGGNRFRGRLDDPLTKKGWTQMDKAIQNQTDWERIISSPLIRCARFAESYARKHNLSLTLDHDLKEIDFGDWEGLSAAQLMETSPEALTDFWRDPLNHSPPNGETLSQFRDRILSAWEQRIKVHTGQRVLLITHGGVIRMLLCHLQNRPLHTLMEQPVQHADLFVLIIEEDRIKQFVTPIHKPHPDLPCSL
jgi:alpha-ribazole phosphatase